MFGSLFKSIIKIATLPIDVTNVVVDKVTGGDGSKSSRTDIPILGDLEDLRDTVADEIEESLDD